MIFYACIHGVVYKVDAKKFTRILNSDSMHSIGIQVLWFKFEIFGQDKILISTHKIVCLEGSVLYISMHLDKWFYASN
jgi:hypothetical protein